MIVDGRLLIYTILLAGILLVLESGWQMMREGPLNKDNGLMRRLLGASVARGTARTETVSAAAAPEPLPLLRPLAALIRDADVGLTPPGLLAIMAGLTLALLVTGSLLHVPGLPCLAGSLAVGIGLPWLVLARRRAVRLGRLEEQLPDALDMMIRGLKVGHPISSTLALVAEQMPAPIGTEFARCVAQVKFGMEVPEAIQKLSERVPLPDYRYLALVIQIQYATGGNLADILEILAQVVRDRFRLFRKVRALTAEGRASAWFVSLYPVAMIGVIQTIKPDFYAQVADHAHFNYAVSFVVFLLVGNLLMMKMITKLKV